MGFWDNLFGNNQYTLCGSGQLRRPSSCDKLEAITMSPNWTSIEAGCFENFHSLKSIQLSESLTAIGYHCFCSCDKLEEIILPDNISEIGHGVFSDCSSLKKCILPSKIKVIPKHMFYGCTSLLEIKVPRGVTKLEQSSFGFCENLEKIILPDGLVEIESGCFQGCKNLKTLDIPESIELIGYNSFAGTDIDFIYVKKASLALKSPDLPVYILGSNFISTYSISQRACISCRVCIIVNGRDDLEKIIDSVHHIECYVNKSPLIIGCCGFEMPFDSAINDIGYVLEFDKKLSCLKNLVKEGKSSEAFPIGGNNITGAIKFSIFSII